MIHARPTRIQHLPGRQMKTAALIVAAGRGMRAGGGLPKQYVPLGGVPVLRRTLDRLLSVDLLDTVLTVIHPDDRARYEGAVEGLSDARLIAPVSGGATRGESVRAGLDQLAQSDTARVLIHDAARPFVSASVIRDVLAALDEADGAFAALPVVDALWRADRDLADQPVARDGLWRAQTPQAFRTDTLRKAYESAQQDGFTGTDEASLVEHLGEDVHVAMGSPRNIKITRPSDLKLAEFYLENPEEGA